MKHRDSLDMALSSVVRARNHARVTGLHLGSAPAEFGRAPELLEILQRARLLLDQVEVALRMEGASG